jgi:hypothetical protein
LLSLVFSQRIPAAAKVVVLNHDQNEAIPVLVCTSSFVSVHFFVNQHPVVLMAQHQSEFFNHLWMEQKPAAGCTSLKQLSVKKITMTIHQMF